MSLNRLIYFRLIDSKEANEPLVFGLSQIHQANSVTYMRIIIRLNQWNYFFGVLHRNTAGMCAEREQLGSQENILLQTAAKEAVSPKGRVNEYTLCTTY